MPWQPRGKTLPGGSRARQRRTARRLRVPFWAGWAVIAGAVGLFLVAKPTLSPSTGQGAGYQCRRNAYDCSDFRTQFQAQAAYQACGGRRNDVHRLDRDRDGFACDRLP